MNPWAACVIGREEYGYRWGNSRSEVIDEAVTEELERRECDGEDPRPVEVLVLGGCVWREREERTDDEPWSHWLETWTSTERVIVEAEP